MDAIDVPADLFEHLADVLRADERRGGARESRSPPLGECVVPAHRILELGAVGLDRVASAGRRTDRPTEQDVIGEHEIGRQQLPDRGRVRLNPALELIPAAVGDALDDVSLVAIEHEHGQQPPDIGANRGCGPEVEARWVAFLRQHRDVVPGQRPLSRQLAGVDVRPRATKEVAVPEQDSQVRWKYNAYNSSTPGFDVCTCTSDGVSMRAEE